MKGHIFCFLLVVACLCAGCANISSPSGGKKDVTPPKLVSVSPADSLLNTRVSELVLRFDEYITVSDAQKEITVSPILAVPPVVTGVNKHVKVKLEDSLLENNTTYRISFGTAIRDLHEGNPLVRYTYTFSTGGYFDSLQLKGTVINAATGMPDTSGIMILLYKVSENDSAVVKKKPQYAIKPDNTGAFHFKGLPGRSFRIYAVKDDNNNLVYDGGTEMVAFNDSLVIPSDSVLRPITLRLFTEIPDTSDRTKDTVQTTKKNIKSKERRAAVVDTNFTYTVNIDTNDITRRTYDITDSIKIVFNHYAVVAKDKIRLTYDSADMAVDVPLRVRTDTARQGAVFAVAKLAENAVYTLQIDSAFAADTGGKKTSPARFRFRTFNDDDYGKIKLNLPGKFYSGKSKSVDSPDHVLMMMAGNDTVYQQKVVDTVVFFTKLRPAIYTFRIIVDKNKDGKWNTGDLLAKKQPEEVIAGPAPLTLKAGWDHTVDFERKPADKKGRIKDKSTQKK